MKFFVKSKCCFKFSKAELLLLSPVDIRIPVERDNYTHYVKITAVNSLGEAGPESKLHSFVVRHSYSRHQQNTRKIGQVQAPGLGHRNGF